MKSRFLFTSLLFFFMAMSSGPTLALQIKPPASINMKALLTVLTLVPIAAHLTSLVFPNTNKPSLTQGSIAWLIKEMANSANQSAKSGN
jgi:DMSO reductase anchor subunit